MTTNDEIRATLDARRRAAVPSGSPAESFVEAAGPDELVLFVLNVGDGDAQVVLLPRDGRGRRRLIVVDVRYYTKVRKLVDALESASLIAAAEQIAVLVATHHHRDHIGGMQMFINKLYPRIAEFWEPGAMPPTAQYVNLMNEVGARHVGLQQPTAGTTRYFGDVRVQVLAPSARLRQQFDTYGVDENDTSLLLRLDYPVKRVVVEAGGERRLVPPGHRSIVLGADAQAASWSHVLADFPALEVKQSPIGAALKEAGYANPLMADVLKVSHHGSKNGTYYELVMRVKPTIACISHKDGSQHGFPHALALESLREAREPIAKPPAPSRLGDDHALGIHQTGTPGLGTIAVILPRAKREQPSVWRFGDGSSETVDLAAGVRCCP